MHEQGDADGEFAVGAQQIAQHAPDQPAFTRGSSNG